MTRVSVVVPTRDRGSLLRLAVQSALRQRGVGVDVIVVDDASADDMGSIVEGFGHVTVRVIRQPRRTGPAGARNRGIEAAEAPWIAFLDDDDVWAPEKLARQTAAAERSGCGWAYTGDVNVDADLRVLGGIPPLPPSEVMASLPRYNPISSGASNVIVRADVLATVGGFDPALHRTEDWDLWLRLARTGPPAYVREPLVAYRFHPQNIVRDLDAVVSEPAILAKRYGIPVDRAAVQRRAAWMCLRAGARLRASGYYARAIALGDVRSVARLAVALLHPAPGSDRLFGLLGRARRDDAWRAAAQKWLDDLAASVPADEHGG